MEIDAARELKLKLENEIKNTITFKLAEFQVSTGLEVSAVNVMLLDVTTFEDNQRRATVGHVEIQTNI